MTKEKKEKKEKKQKEYKYKNPNRKSELIESVFGFIVYITTLFIGSSIVAFFSIYLMDKYVM